VRSPIIAGLRTLETAASSIYGDEQNRSPDGACQRTSYDPSDRFVNTILPDTGVLLFVNFADPWAIGRSETKLEVLPQISVIGPHANSLPLQMGQTVATVISVLAPAAARDVLGASTATITNRILPLDHFWTSREIETMFRFLSRAGLRRCAAALRDQLASRASKAKRTDAGMRSASRVIASQSGRVSITHLANRYGVSRQLFTYRFRNAVGLPPKLFARIVRFKHAVHVLKSTDVSDWASVAPAIGFYDQAHMINEFRFFVGMPPGVFFRSPASNPPTN
jgi:AraC-like DNA-binding protein